MTLRLILMRHAKSSWDSPSDDDHDRTLNDRGRASAVCLGQWLQNKAYLPDLVLSSDSMRTQETWALVSDAFADKPAVQWHRALYLAAAQNMLDMLRGAETAQSVLMLGHNPGIAQFADMLVKLAPNHPRFRDYPTGATTIIEFPAETWADVDWGTGQVVDFIVPREI